MFARWIAAALVLVLSMGVFFSNAVPDPWRVVATAVGFLVAAFLLFTTPRRPPGALAPA